VDLVSPTGTDAVSAFEIVQCRPKVVSFMVIRKSQKRDVSGDIRGSQFAGEPAVEEFDGDAKKHFTRKRVAARAAILVLFVGFLQGITGPAHHAGLLLSAFTCRLAQPAARFLAE